MRREFVIRWEGDDLVLFIVADRTDFIELAREVGACPGVDVGLCAGQIDGLMLLAEMEHGGPLPWAFVEDETDGRVAWTGSLGPANPVRI